MRGRSPSLTPERRCWEGMGHHGEKGEGGRPWPRSPLCSGPGMPGQGQSGARKDTIFRKKSVGVRLHIFQGGGRREQKRGSMPTMRMKEVCLHCLSTGHIPRGTDLWGGLGVTGGGGGAEHPMRESGAAGPGSDPGRKGGGQTRLKRAVFLTGI